MSRLEENNDGITKWQPNGKILRRCLKENQTMLFRFVPLKFQKEKLKKKLKKYYTMSRYYLFLEMQNKIPNFYSVVYFI